MIEGIEIETNSGNVFADLGLADAEKLKIKSGLVIEITRAVRRLGLTQEEAGRRMGIAQPKVSGIMRGDFANLSERKLMECLNRLGYDIEIKVRPAAGPIGHLTLAIALRTVRAFQGLARKSYPHAAPSSRRAPSARAMH